MGSEYLFEVEPTAVAIFVGIALLLARQTSQLLTLSELPQPRKISSSVLPCSLWFLLFRFFHPHGKLAEISNRIYLATDVRVACKLKQHRKEPRTLWWSAQGSPLFYFSSF